jgi:hypothetical protein
MHSHKNRLEVELLCSCSLTSKWFKGSNEFTNDLTRCVQVEDTKIG